MRTVMIQKPPVSSCLGIVISFRCARLKRPHKAHVALPTSNKTAFSTAHHCTGCLMAPASLGKSCES